MTETNLDNKVINLVLTDDWFVDNQINTSNLALNNAPQGLTIKSVSWIDSQHVFLTLAFDGMDFDQDISNFSINLNQLELAGFNSLTSNTLSIAAFIESRVDVLTDHELFKLYPNPCQGRFKLEFKNSRNGLYTLTLLGSNGVVIDRIKIPGFGSVNEFDFSHLSKGVYYIILDDTNRFYAKSFIVN
jgi:hypothetical protein